jgi:hypothetical protein
MGYLNYVGDTSKTVSVFQKNQNRELQIEAYFAYMDALYAQKNHK